MVFQLYRNPVEDAAQRRETEEKKCLVCANHQDRGPPCREYYRWPSCKHKEDGFRLIQELPRQEIQRLRNSLIQIRQVWTDVGAGQLKHDQEAYAICERMYVIACEALNE
ncbi:MAG: hypothetical protein BMS9Abin02_2130 [Anaerolineae bacterium]|nr:MAG: hypothetical protein BMS9Abin02_2130 [Anaerolineae bacterium]